MAPHDNNGERSPSRLGRTTGEAMIPRTDRATDPKVPDENGYMSAPIGSYAFLGIPDFGRVFEFRWRRQRHHSPHTLASVVPRIFPVFHCAFGQGASIRTAHSVFRSGSERCNCAGVDNHAFFSGFDWSAYGLPKVIVYFTGWIRAENSEDLA